MWVIWLLFFLIFLVIEMITLGLTTIWFAIGSIAASLVAALGGPEWLQITVFILTSVVMLIFTRPIAMKYFNQKRVRTNLDAIIGEKAVVTELIANLKGTGKVEINGMEWTARTEDDSEIPVKEIVNVKRIQGVKVIVEREKK